MFDQQLFEQQLATSWLGRSFFFFEELDSTNSYAKNAPAKAVVQGSLVVADKQNKGRGQHGNRWEAEPGSNLTFSLVFNPPKAERLTVLTLAGAAAVADVLSQYVPDNRIQLKWPNDVLCGGRKIAGLLTEVVYNGNELDRLVLGIGVNINQQTFTPELQEKATSVKQEIGRNVYRETILSEFLSRIEYNYQRWLNHDIELIREINPMLHGFGEWVNLTIDGKPVEGEYKFLGMNEKGELQVLNKDYEVNIFSYEQVRVLCV